jgi:hypothetical protein
MDSRDRLLIGEAAIVVICACESHLELDFFHFRLNF